MRDFLVLIFFVLPNQTGMLSFRKFLTKEFLFGDLLSLYYFEFSIDEEPLTY